MLETSDQVISRLIDRLRDLVDRGNEPEKKQLVDLLGIEDMSIYRCLADVEDAMQERLDRDWQLDDPEDNDLPSILKFPKAKPRKKVARSQR